MLKFEDALAQLLAAAQPLTDVETVIPLPPMAGSWPKIWFPPWMCRPWITRRWTATPCGWGRWGPRVFACP